jgi:hypothetical protein
MQTIREMHDWTWQAQTLGVIGCGWAFGLFIGLALRGWGLANAEENLKCKNKKTTNRSK